MTRSLVRVQARAPKGAGRRWFDSIRTLNFKHMHYVYALWSSRQKKFYIGQTNDLKRRIAEHKNGKTQTTDRLANWKLVYYEACLSKKDAEHRERQLKTGFGRGFLKRRLKNFLK